MSTHPKPLQRVNPYNSNGFFGFYVYPAETDAVVTGTIDYTNPGNDFGSGPKIYYLDRHYMNCAAGNALLSSFHFQGSGTVFSFNYKCQQYSQSLTCNSFQYDSSWWLATDKVDLSTMGSSDIACGSDEALQSIGWQRSGDNARARWTCCSFASTLASSPVTSCVYYTGWTWRAPLGDQVPVGTTIATGDYILR